MNEETLREDFEKEFGESKYYGASKSRRNEIADFWLTKFQEREAQLWQEMEDMKAYQCKYPELCEKYNEGIEDCQSYLSLPVNKE
jgi:hypothetical protein